MGILRKIELVNGLGRPRAIQNTANLASWGRRSFLVPRDSHVLLKNTISRARDELTESLAPKDPAISLPVKFNNQHSLESFLESLLSKNVNRPYLGNNS